MGPGILRKFANSKNKSIDCIVESPRMVCNCDSHITSTVRRDEIAFGARLFYSHPLRRGRVRVAFFDWRTRPNGHLATDYVHGALRHVVKRDSCTGLRALFAARVFSATVTTCFSWLNRTIGKRRTCQSALSSSVCFTTMPAQIRTAGRSFGVNGSKRVRSEYDGVRSRQS